MHNTVAKLVNGALNQSTGGMYGLATPPFQLLRIRPAPEPKPNTTYCGGSDQAGDISHAPWYLHLARSGRLLKYFAPIL